MNKKQKIQSIEYDHEAKRVVIQLRKKMPSFGLGGKELILLLWGYFVTENSDTK